MKKITTISCIMLLLSMLCISCDKYIEDKKEEAVVTEITKGDWKVSKYKEGSTSLLSGFTPWTFKFNSNNTCVATNDTNTSSTYSGTWSGNSTTFYFTIAFNTTPADPLPKLAGDWKTVSVGDGWSRFVKGIDTLEIKRQ